jgi:hypothetical protein
MFHVVDLTLFTLAIFYGFLMDGSPDYRTFNHNASYLNFFRAMLFFAWCMYVGIAIGGGANGVGLVLYASYIMVLLMREEWVYYEGIQLQTSFWKILSIELGRELLLISAGFWKIP